MFIKSNRRALSKVSVAVIAALLVFGVSTGIATAGGDDQDQRSWQSDRSLETSSRSNDSSTVTHPNRSEDDVADKDERPKDTAAPGSHVYPAAQCNRRAAFSKLDLYVDGKQVPTLGGGQVSPGSTVVVDFEIAPGCINVPVALVSYEAVEGFYTDTNVSEQTYYQSMSGNYSAGKESHTMRVDVPNCYFQVDFVTDKAYKHINERTYLGTLVEADTGGHNACVEKPATTKKPVPTTEPPVVVQECPENIDARITEYDGFDYTEGNYRDVNGDNRSRSTTAKVSFTIAEGCEEKLSLVSYEAESKSDSQSEIVKQNYFDSETRTFDEGTHTMTVDLPECVFQVDFVRGDVIRQFGPVGSDNFYWEQGRLLDSDFGGNDCIEATTTTTEAPAEVQEETVVRAQPRLADTGFALIPATGLATLLTAAGAGLLRAGKRRRDEMGYWVD